MIIDNNPAEDQLLTWWNLVGNWFKFYCREGGCQHFQTVLFNQLTCTFCSQKWCCHSLHLHFAFPHHPSCRVQSELVQWRFLMTIIAKWILSIQTKSDCSRRIKKWNHSNCNCTITTYTVAFLVVIEHLIVYTDFHALITNI